MRTLLTTTAADVTSYNNTGLSSGKHYYYRLRATNITGDSSNTAAANTWTIPDAPTNLTVTSTTSTSVGLSWTGPVGAASYTLLRQTGTGSYTQIASGITGTTYTDSTVSPSTTYSYEVTATDPGGTSVTSAAVSTTTPSGVPAAPSSLSATTLSDSSIGLSWTDNSSDETGFKIERSLDPSTWSSVTTTAADATTYTDTGSEDGTNYYYRVRATNAAGDSSNSNVASAITTMLAPSALSASSAGPTQVSLSWTDNSATAANYTVERSPDNSTWTVLSNSLLSDASGYTDTTASDGVLTYYRVRATNSVTASAYVSTSITPNPSADLSIVVGDLSGGTTAGGNTSGGTVTSNGTITYSVVVASNGPNAVSGASVVDIFPSTLTGVTYTSQMSGSGSDSNAAGSGNLNDLITLTSGSSITYTVTGTVSPTAGNFIVDTASVTAPAGCTDANTSNNTSTDTLSMPTGVSASIHVDGDPTAAIPGQAISFTIGVQNDGPNGVSGVSVSNLIPAGIMTGSFFYTAADNGMSAAGYTAIGSGAINDDVNLPAGASIHYSVTGIIASSATGTLSDTVSVATPAGITNTEANVGNRVEQTSGTLLTPQAELGVDINGANPLTVGEQDVYSIVVTNYVTTASGSDAVGATISTDALSQFTGIHYSSSILYTPDWVMPSSISSPSGTVDDGAAFYDTFNLSAGSIIEFNITGTVASGASGSIANTATVSLPGIDVDPDNNSSTVTATVGGGTSGSVVGRDVLYANSFWDTPTSSNPSFSSAPDTAIAPDKLALLPGQSAQFTNYTSYTNGINGVSVDLTGDVNQTISLDDFAFFVGNDNSPANWSAAPAPAGISLYPGAGINGSDRVQINWASGAILNQWLQVIVLPGQSDTNLAAADVFYFGNAPGEVGDSVTDAYVTSADELAVRNDTHTTRSDPATIANPHDFNRDSKTDSTDQLYARNHHTDSSSALTLISPTYPDAVPSEFTAVANGTDEIDLSWTNTDSSAAGTEIWRSVDGTNFTDCAMAAPGAFNFHDTSVLENSRYFYQIRAVTLHGDSSFTIPSVASTLPIAPDQLLASPDPTAGIDLQWTSTSSAYQFEVDRRPAGMGAFSLLADTSVAAFTDADATPLSAFDYQVIALGVNSTSAPSNSATTTAPLAPPANLSFQTISTSEIDLTWNNITQPATAIEVDRSIDDVNFSAISTLPSTATGFSDASLSEDSHEFYQVKAIDGAVASAAASIDAYSLPAAPSNLTAVATVSNNVNEVDLTWTNNSAAAAQFEVIRTDSTETVTILGTATTNAFQDLTANAATSYTYSVVAETPSLANSAVSNVASITTPIASAATLNATAASANEIDLSWTLAPTSASDVNIYGSTDGQIFSLLTQTALSAGQTTYAVTGLLSHANYWYEILADAAGMPTWFSTTQTQTLPATPISLASTSADTAVQLTWAGDTDSSITYDVYRKDPGASDFAYLGNVSDQSYTDLELSPSTTYQYQIVAVDIFSNYSAASGTISVATTSGQSGGINPLNSGGGPAGSTAPPTYVHVNGNIGSDAMGVTGATASPFLTIGAAAAYAASLAGANVIVLIASGTYRETVTVQSDNITFMPEPGASVTVSGLNPVNTWNAPIPGAYGLPIYTADLSTQNSPVLPPTGQSASYAYYNSITPSSVTLQPVLGPSDNTPTNQIFYNDGVNTVSSYTMVPEARFPENPLPGTNETANTTQYLQENGTSPGYNTVFRIPVGDYTGDSNASSGQPVHYAFTDPNLENFASDDVSLQKWLVGATIHIIPGGQNYQDTYVTKIINGVPTKVDTHIANTPLIGYQQSADVGETATIISAKMITPLDVSGKPEAPVPQITYTPNAVSSFIGGDLNHYPVPGDFYYISNFNENTVNFQMALDRSAAGGSNNNTPQKDTSGTTVPETSASFASCPAYIIDHYATPGAASSGDLYLHIKRPINSAPKGIEVKLRDVAFDLRGHSNVTIQGITMIAATVETDKTSQNDNIVHVTAEYLSGYDRTGNAIPPPIHNANGTYSYDLNAYNYGTNIGVVTNRNPAKQKGAAGYLQFIAGIELLGSGDQLLDSTIEYSAANAVTIGNQSVVVSGNTIHDVDTMAGDNGAIRADPYATGAVGVSGNAIQISYNHIFNGARSLILDTGPEQYTYVIGNDLSNFGLQTTDCGAIYVHSADQTYGTDSHSKFEYNIIHDGYSGESTGIYLDNGHHDVLVDHNILYNLERGMVDNPPPPNSTPPLNPLPADQINNNTIDQIGYIRRPPDFEQNYVWPYSKNGVNVSDIIKYDLDSSVGPAKPGAAPGDALVIAPGLQTDPNTDVFVGGPLPLVSANDYELNASASTKEKAAGAIMYGIPVFRPGTRLSASVDPATGWVTLRFDAAMLPPSGISVTYVIYRVVGTTATAVQTIADTGQPNYTWPDTSGPVSGVNSVGYFVYVYTGTPSAPLINSSNVQGSYIPFAYGSLVKLQQTTFGNPMEVTNTVYVPTFPDLALHKLAYSQAGGTPDPALAVVDGNHNTSFSAQFPASTAGNANILLINLARSYKIAETDVTFNGSLSSFQVFVGTSSTGPWAVGPRVYNLVRGTNKVTGLSLTGNWLRIDLYASVGSVVTVYDVNAFGAIPDLALNATTYSRYAGTPAYAVDGNPATAFVSAQTGGADFLMIDLGMPYTIDEVQLTFAGANSLSSYVIQASTQSNTFPTRGPIISSPPSGTNDVANFSLFGRYVLISLLGPSPVNISDAKVFGA